jgi:hypothetical protein
MQMLIPPKKWCFGNAAANAIKTQWQENGSVMSTFISANWTKTNHNQAEHPFG